MPNDQLTPARLRELIAAATPGPWDRPTDEGNHLALCIDHPETGHQCIADFPYRNINHEEDAQLVRSLVNNAPTLADALEAKELLEWLDGRIVDGAIREVVTNPDSVCLVSPESRETWGDTLIDALRAAKEAAL